MNYSPSDLTLDLMNNLFNFVGIDRRKMKKTPEMDLMDLIAVCGFKKKKIRI